MKIAQVFKVEALYLVSMVYCLVWLCTTWNKLVKNGFGGNF